MNRKHNAMMGALMGMMMADTTDYNVYKEHLDPNKPKEPVIPKGCRMFYFDKDGQEVHANTEGIVFDCVALNSKSAAIKFKNYATG